MTSEKKRKISIEQARKILDFNWTGSYTQPGPRLYPHQWSWDSGLVAFGYARYDTSRAVRELRHLFSAQWKNGLLPQIVFNPEFGNYFPGPGFWHAKESPDAPEHHKTSGVVQPPVHATAVLHTYRHAGDEKEGRRFLEEAYPHLRSWHDYLYRERDPEDEGLVYIRHPWESGMDNSPLWDTVMLAIHLKAEEIPRYHRADTHTVSAADRPTSSAYDRFAWLVRFFAEREYDEAKIREDCPFLVQDVLFNALLYRSDQDLAEIARILGEDPSPMQERGEKTRRAMNEKLWDEEHAIYLDYDLVSERKIQAYVTPNFVPLYAGVPDEEQARRMVESLKGYFDLENEKVIPIPCYDVHGFGFSPVQYWRGPVWININWFLMRGLERYGHGEEARRLRESIANLVEDSGFHEYFDPFDGSGHGSVFFSWTAALYLDTVMEEEG